jgi:GTP-binding protein HflX
VESFKSTLDEVRESDILLHVVDISHPQYEDQIEVVNRTLADLKVLDKPTIMIFNKMDLYEKQTFDEWLADDVKDDILFQLKQSWQQRANGNCVFIAATERRNVEELRKTILEKVMEMYRQRFPYKSEYFF